MFLFFFFWKIASQYVIFTINHKITTICTLKTRELIRLVWWVWFFKKNIKYSLVFSIFKLNLPFSHANILHQLEQNVTQSFVAIIYLHLRYNTKYTCRNETLIADCNNRKIRISWMKSFGFVFCYFQNNEIGRHNINSECSKFT